MTMLWNEIEAARRAAHAKHGANSIESEPGDSPRWLAILVEEVGEVANALTYDGPRGNVRSELIDVLAVASAWVDSLDVEVAVPSRHEHGESAAGVDDGGAGGESGP
jgi:NTP pyrophosphatase (non-canonical NTP hydrolase)